MNSFCLSPQIEQRTTNVRVLHTNRTVEIPGVRDAALTSARFVWRKPIFEQRIIERLHLPGHNSLLHVDVPTASAGAIDSVCRTDHFVVLPAVAIELFPRARFRTDQIFDPVHCFVLLTNSSRTPRSRFLQAACNRASNSNIDATPITKNLGSIAVTATEFGCDGFANFAL